LEDAVETVADQKQLESQIIEALKTCYDPEIPVDIYEMGLIYGVDVDPLGGVLITMTLTSPHCPAAEALPSEVQEKVESVPGVKDVRLDLVWEPPWDPDRMTEAAKLQLGML
jgi:FeS assembly SUF system protein